MGVKGKYYKVSPYVTSTLSQQIQFFFTDATIETEAKIGPLLPSQRTLKSDTKHEKEDVFECSRH